MNSYFARGHVMFDNDSFCLAWQIIDYTFTACIIWCKAIFTLERYILVFYPNNFHNQRQKLLFHYIPLIVINIYLILFYILINVLCPWPYESTFSKHLCGTQCLDLLNGVATFNWIFNILFPAFIIIFGSVFLLLKVLWKRREMQRNLRNWSKNWKMLIQLLGIAIIYIIIWIPLSIISIISMFNKFDNDHENIADHFYFLTYICELTVPIIALVFWPEIMQKLRARFRSNSIVSITMGGQSTN